MPKKLLQATFAFTILVASTVLSSGAWAQTPPFTRTVIVNNTGSASANGAALLSALSSLSPAPNFLNIWVIQLEGGLYNVGNTQVVLPPFVNLAGAGIRASTIRGNFVGPLLTDALVMGSTNSEIRDLTIECLSPSGSSGCRGVGLNSANTLLYRVLVWSHGQGTGSHWGIRTFDSRPELDQVEILVDSSSSANNYGIVYGGSSEMEIARSKIRAINAQTDNWAVALRETPLNSSVIDTTIVASGGDEAAGIYYRAPFSGVDYFYTNVSIIAYGATHSIALGGPSAGGPFQDPRIFFRNSRAHGHTHGIDHQRSRVFITNSEVLANQVRVNANEARIGDSWLHGSGTITGSTVLICAGNFDGGFAFFPSTCP
ncbi:MAG: hypothetical protein MI919_38620 [Holophagales bacterium]|nr:hypothetical protein [Holophagales bacterium]